MLRLRLVLLLLLIVPYVPDCAEEEYENTGVLGVISNTTNPVVKSVSCATFVVAIY